jgi:hypothetical protein
MSGHEHLVESHPVIVRMIVEREVHRLRQRLHGIHQTDERIRCIQIIVFREIHDVLILPRAGIHESKARAIRPCIAHALEL